MALLSNVPTLSYIRWQNLLIIYKDEVYQIYNNHTNKPFIYFDAINSPNELIMSNKKLEERDGLFYIIFNDNGKYIIVPQTEIEINFSENGSVDAVSSKILGFKEQLNEQSQKVVTIETDVEGMKTTVSKFEESIIKNETTMSTLEQRANEIDAEVEKITMDFSDDIVIRELRENTTMAILSIQSTLGLFSSDMNTYMKDNRLSSAETDEINAYKENLNNELTLMNLQVNNVIDLLEDKGEVEKVTRLNTAIEKLNTAINNLYTNIDTCSVDNVFTNNEIATIISYFGKANVAINELKNLIDECIYLSLGGRLVEEIGKIIVKQDQIQLSVSKNENSIRSTLSKEMSLVQDVVDENIISLNNFRDCLNTISTDGAFTSDEINVITTRANDLDINFDEMTSKKSEIEDNTLLSNEQKEEIDQSYTNYKTAHNNLLSNINTITADGLMTTEEMISINEEIENYKNEINNMNTVLCSSLEEINKNGITTDINNVDKKWAEIILDPENGIQSQVGDIQKQINDGGGIIERLNTAEQKITSDAIINTVSSTFYSKEEVDDKLDDIDIGLVVKSIDVMYYLSTSNKTLEGGTWVTEAPSLEDGGYIWSKTVTTYTNETKNETDPICIAGGKDGQTLYTWIKYSDNEDGSNMYDTPSDNTLYIGIATNKESETESSNPSDYTWSKFKGVDGNSYYTWIRYADDKDGNGISDNPTGKLYIGFAYNKTTSTESNNASDYTWSLIKGADGINGTDGTNGIDGVDGKDGITYYTWIKYSDNANGSNMYDTPNDNTKYIGIATNQTEKAESSDYTKYVWSKFRGEDGADGADGVPGKDGVTTYTWIKYADDSNGNGISNNPTNKSYIGFAYNKTTNIESNSPSDYTWSLIKGADGADGQDGKDGTSVTILGSYNSVGELNQAHPNNNNNGDGYIVNGDLYIWNGKSFINVGQIKGEDGKNGADGQDGKNGLNAYVHIKYSNDGGKTFTPSNGEEVGDYLGIYTDYYEADSTDVTKYTWSKIKGQDGVNGTTYYTWIKYSDNANGSNMYDTPKDSTKYIGIATNKTTKTESTDPTAYTWSKFRGEDGTDGVPGTNGKDGVTTYTWIKYADDSNGNGISNNPTGKEYIGFAYNKTTATESNVPSDYMWSLIKGTDGIDGTNGVDGVTYYTWIKYSDNADGTGLYDTPNSKTKYIGIATNKTTATESTNKTDYVWSKFRGEDGTDGKGIVTVVDYYKVHASDIGVTNATSGFSTDVPQMDATNKYLWSYELITYTDNSTTKTNARVIGVYGENGTDGKGISSIVEYYAVNNSSTTTPTSFGTTIPTISTTNRFLWNYEVINFTDGSKKTTDKRIIGVYGETGKTGRGISSIVEQYYLSTSKTSQTGGSWVDTPPTWVKGKYMWTRSKITYSDNSIEYTTPICDNTWEIGNGLQDQIDNNKTEITTTKNKVATIEINLNGITQRVSSTESTVSSHTTQLGTVDSRINTAKNSAISTASSDATTKANNALASAKTDATTKANNALADAKNYTNGQITTVNTTINNKVAEIKATTDAITQRVSSTETITNEMSGTVNNLKSSCGLAYAKDIIVYGDSDKYYPVYVKGGNQDIVRTIKIWRSFYEQGPDDWNTSTHRGGLLFTWQGNFGGWGGSTYKESILENESTYTTLLADCGLRVYSQWYVFFLRGGGSGGASYHFASDQELNLQVYYNGSSELIWSSGDYKQYADNYRTTVDTTRLNNLKLAKESSVTAVDAKITTTKNKVATIETNVGSITSKVSNLETTTTTLNGKVTGIDTRLKTAEQKITDEAIINTVSSTYATKTDVNKSVSGAYSQIEQLSNKISSKVSSSDVSSIIRQSPSDIQVGFNGINDRIEINGQYLKFEAENGNRDMLLYGGQVCIYNNTDNTFIGTLGHVLRADTSYKGIGFLTGKNCNTFFIGRDSSWSNILTNRSPNPTGVFFINFASNADGDKGIHIRDNLYTTNNIQAINNTQPTITGFKDIACTNSIFDNWKSVVDQSTIMRYDGAHNVCLGKNLDGNGFMATGFKDITCTNNMFSYWKSTTDQSTIMRYDGTNNIILGKNLYGNGFTATGFSTITASQFTVSNSSSFRIARGTLYDPKNGSVNRDYVKLDGTYLKGGTSEICFIRADNADWANIYAGTIYSKQTAVTSDMNLKTDIKYVNIDTQTISEDSGLMAPNVNITTEDMHEFIETLPMVSYRMKDDVKNGIDDTYYGFLAQEVLYTKVGSELIKIEETTNEKGETNESYRYSENKFASFIAGALQEEIKERKEEIENLNNTIISLEERIKDLENKLNK